MGAPPTLDQRDSVAWVRRLARTTPGVVGMIAVAVAAFCVLAGLVCGGQLDGRISEHKAVLDRSEPLVPGSFVTLRPYEGLIALAARD